MRLSPVLVLSLLAACRATPAPGEPSSRPAAAPVATPAAAPAPDARAHYTLVEIKTGPQSGKLAKAENDAAFQGHFANMGRMAREGQLLTAGPYGEHRHDPALRGLFLLATGERSEAERWASTDPTAQAGVFVLEYHALATDAPLAAALARALEREDAARAEGRTPPPGEGARPYVWLTAEHGDLARREFEPLCSVDGGVYLIGELEGGRARLLLDAPDLATAEERFAPQLAEIGSHHLDEWYASAELAAMVGAP